MLASSATVAFLVVDHGAGIEGVAFGPPRDGAGHFLDDFVLAGCVFVGDLRAHDCDWRRVVEIRCAALAEQTGEMRRDTDAAGCGGSRQRAVIASGTEREKGVLW